MRSSWPPHSSVAPPGPRAKRSPFGTALGTYGSALVRAALGVGVVGLVVGCAHGNAVDGTGGSGGMTSTSGASMTTHGSTSSHTTTTTTSSAMETTSSSTSSATTTATTTTTTTSTTTSASTTASTSTASSSSSSTGSSAPGTLYFSEYVEGSSNNKALEIFNAGSTTIDLSTCEIDRYQNGSSSASPPVTLDAFMLGPGQVFVICNTGFAQQALCDQKSGSVQHTGNDVVELACNGVLLDAFGKIGDNNTWGTAPTTSMDATLRRKCSVTVGDKNPNDTFDPAQQWDGYPVDDFDDLGKYICP